MFCLVFHFLEDLVCDIECLVAVDDGNMRIGIVQNCIFKTFKFHFNGVGYLNVMIFSGDLFFRIMENNSLN